MLNAIINNPYRILGTFADATETDILAAAERLKLSPTITCETDFNIEGLPKPRRDPNTISMATKAILDSSDAYLYKLFWFLRPSDEACLNYLKAGELSNARRKLVFNTRIESEHNLMICCLIEGMYDHVARIAYKVLSNPNYCETVLLTKKSRSDLFNGFRNRLFNASNDASVPSGTTMSWKQYLQDMILNSISNTINTKFLQPARLKIKKGIPSTYIDALSTLIPTCYQRYLYALQSFADTTDPRYMSLMREVVDSAQEWIEVYIISSQDILKHRAVKSEALSFSRFAPSKIQSSYLGLLGIFFQDTGGLLMSPDICQICFSTAYKLFHFYSEGQNVSLQSYKSLIEQTSSSFNEVQKALGRSNWCYTGLANLMAEIGLITIEQELVRSAGKQSLADAASIISYIDHVVDRKLLYTQNVAKRDSCMNRLCVLAGQTSQQGFDRGQINRTATRPSERGVRSVSSTQKKDSSLIKSSSVYKFILFALLVEVVFGLLLGNIAMLSVGMVLAFGYILGVFLAEKSFDKDAKKMVYIYVITQAVISVVGFLVI